MGPTPQHDQRRDELAAARLDPQDLAAPAPRIVGYGLTCVGITFGFHRLLSHHAFQTYPSVRYALAVLGTLAVEGSAIKWVTDHRKHHDFADEVGDPHTPHGGGPGVLGAARGLWHAHLAGSSPRSARQTAADTAPTC